MSAKHTPGPWAVEPGDPLCVWEFDPKLRDDDRYLVPLADCRTDAGRSWGRELQRPEAEAYARLIAAAPDLLEALQYVMSAHGEQLTDAFEQAHKAIAKATGAPQ